MGGWEGGCMDGKIGRGWLCGCQPPWMGGCLCELKKYRLEYLASTMITYNNI